MHLFQEAVDTDVIVFSEAKVWTHFHRPYSNIFK